MNSSLVLDGPSRVTFHFELNWIKMLKLFSVFVPTEQKHPQNTETLWLSGFTWWNMFVLMFLMCPPCSVSGERRGAFSCLQHWQNVTNRIRRELLSKCVLIQLLISCIGSELHSNPLSWHFCWFSSLNVTICCFSLSFLTVNEVSLGFETFNDVTSGLKKIAMSIFHFYFTDYGLFHGQLTW